jgi:uncharacterized protein (DUF433 family)
VRAGIRIPVVTILGLLGTGLTHDEVIGYYPQLDREDILGCLQYAAAALNERISPLRQAEDPPTY